MAMKLRLRNDVSAVNVGCVPSQAAIQVAPSCSHKNVPRRPPHSYAPTQSLSLLFEGPQRRASAFDAPLTTTGAEFMALVSQAWTVVIWRVLFSLEIGYMQRLRS